MYYIYISFCNTTNGGGKIGSTSGFSRDVSGARTSTGQLANVTPSTVSRGTARTPYGATELTPYSAPGVGYYYIGEDQKVAYATPKSVAYLTPIKARETLEAEKRGDIKPLTPQDRSTLTYISNYNVGNWQMTPEEFKGTKTLTRQVSVSVQQPTIAPDLSAIDLAPKKLEAEIALRQNKIGNIFLTGYEGYKRFKGGEEAIKRDISKTIGYDVYGLGASLGALGGIPGAIGGAAYMVGSLALEKNEYIKAGAWGASLGALGGIPGAIGGAAYMVGSLAYGKRLDVLAAPSLEAETKKQQAYVEQVAQQSMRETLATGQVSGYRQELFDVKKITDEAGNINYTLIPKQAGFNKYFSIDTKNIPTEKIYSLGSFEKALAVGRLKHPIAYNILEMGTVIAGTAAASRIIPRIILPAIEKIPSIETPWGKIRGATEINYKTITPESQINFMQKYPYLKNLIYQGESKSYTIAEVSRFWGAKAPEYFNVKLSTNFMQRGLNVRIRTIAEAMLGGETVGATVGSDLILSKAGQQISYKGINKISTFSEVGGKLTSKNLLELESGRLWKPPSTPFTYTNKYGELTTTMMPNKNVWLIKSNVRSLNNLNIWERNIQIPNIINRQTDFTNLFRYSSPTKSYQSIAMRTGLKTRPTIIEHNIWGIETGATTSPREYDIYKIITRGKTGTYDRSFYNLPQTFTKPKVPPDVSGDYYFTKGGFKKVQKVYPIKYYPTTEEISAGKGLILMEQPKPVTVVKVSTKQAGRILSGVKQQQTLDVLSTQLKRVIPTYNPAYYQRTEQIVASAVALGSREMYRRSTGLYPSLEYGTETTGEYESIFITRKEIGVGTKTAPQNLYGLSYASLTRQGQATSQTQGQLLSQKQIQITQQLQGQLLMGRMLRPPNIPNITTPQIEAKIPFIPPFILPPFLSPSAEAVGARKVKARRITKYTPSYGALVFKIKGRPAKKTSLGYTGLELRKIPAGFNYGKTFKRIIKRKIKRRK